MKIVKSNKENLPHKNFHFYRVKACQCVGGSVIIAIEDNPDMEKVLKKYKVLNVLDTDFNFGVATIMAYVFTDN